MFNRTAPDNRPNDVIDSIVQRMADTDPTTPEYTTMVDHLTKLYAINSAKDSTRLSKETLATILANLAGIGMIVGHERANVVTSKALGFIIKARQ